MREITDYSLLKMNAVPWSRSVGRWVGQSVDWYEVRPAKDG
jgi:hypothetical protein